LTIIYFCAGKVLMTGVQTGRTSCLQFTFLRDFFSAWECAANNPEDALPVMPIRLETIQNNHDKK
jgi:hypothetical protein